MPYIKLDERPKFKPFIQQVLSTVLDGHESMYVKGEYFGYFVNRLVHHYLNDANGAEQSFNCQFFNEGSRKTLRDAADHVGALLNRSDPLESAGDLNYSISATYWGLLGEAPNADKARYGWRAYLDGMLEMIYHSLGSGTVGGSQKEMTMAFRRHLVVRGVMQHIFIEAYRRKTSIYENDKIKENGDVWREGQLVGTAE